jgi:hypothetical protein
MPRGKQVKDLDEEEIQEGSQSGEEEQEEDNEEYEIEAVLNAKPGVFENVRCTLNTLVFAYKAHLYATR